MAGTGEVISISGVPGGWWLLTRPGGDQGPWERAPLIGLALVEDGGSPFVVGLTAPPFGEVIELADAGRYLHDSGFMPCECGAPQRLPWDEDWCRVCAGVLA